MAIKKKTSKKTVRKTSKKAAGSSKKKSASKVKNIVDRVLVKMNPQLQDKIAQLTKTLEDSRDARRGDLSLLAGKILIRAQEISRSLRGLKKKGEK